MARLAKFQKAQRIAAFIRDIGLILGFPVVVWLGSYFYQERIKVIKAENESLKTSMQNLTTAYNAQMQHRLLNGSKARFLS
jgi:uncharacterized membrane protein